MPAVSMTGNDVIYYDNIKMLANESGNMADSISGNERRSEAELLIGNGYDWAEGLTTADAVIEAAKKKYFLGIASDFCVFLEGGFKPKTADAEGRVAARYIDASGVGYDYQIGSGDYGNDVKLENTDNYKGITNFAHIIAGDSNSEVANNGKITDIATANGDDKKTLVVNAADINDCKHHNGQKVYGSCEWCDGQGDQIYQKELINFDKEFEYIRSQSEKLSKINGIEITADDIIGDEVIFDAGEGCTNEVVYFTVDASLIGQFTGKTFRFKNIPKLDGTIKSEIKDDKIYGEDVIKEFPQIANIVINVKGSNYNSNSGNEGPATDKTIDFGIGKPNITNTYVNDILVSNINRPGIEGGDEATNNKTNNHPYSEKILYNFNEADYIYMNSNFNGTILAPNAEVYGSYKNADGTLKDNGCHGHLSGSLIAKSFEGGLEFGYRPYRGTVDILPSNSGYGVPIKKLIEDGDVLPGATFGVFEGNNETPTSTFTTDGNGEAYIDIESKVDFTGGTDYKTELNVIPTHYTIKETKAPAGYVKDDTKTYEVDVEETVSRTEGDIKTIDGKSIPTKVTTVITQGSTTYTIELHDIYSYEGGTYKRIMRELKIYDAGGTLKDTFQMPIDNTGKVISVRKVTGNSTDSITQYIDTGRKETVDITKPQKHENLLAYNLDENTVVYKLEESIEYTYENGDFVEIRYVNDEGNYVNISAEAEKTLIQNPKLKSWEEIVDTVVYKFEDDTIIHKNEDGKWVYTDADNVSVEVENKNNQWVYTNADGEEVPVKEGAVPTETFEAWVENTYPNEEDISDVVVNNVDNISEKSAYTISQLAWNGPDYPTVDKLTFYYSDGTSKTGNVEVKGQSTWNTFSLGDLPKENVIGVKIVTSGDKAEKLCIQYANPNNNNQSENIPGWGCANGVTGTFFAGVTPTTHTEEKSEQETKTICVREPTKDEIDVTEPNVISLYESIDIRDNKYESNGINYKYDPDKIMMMPQPSSTQTFTNNRGLIFKKVSKLGTADPTALKGATINVCEVNSTTLVTTAVMNDILNGDSETTIDLTAIDESKLYCFEEPTQLVINGVKYEQADPIYFKKSGTTIYYTQDANKATSGTTAGWDSVNITDTTQAITMVDIQISGAKIKLGKYMTNYTTRLSGATFQLMTGNGHLIYPLSEDETFEIPGDKDFDLYETLKQIEENEKNSETKSYDTKYIKNGYLKPGQYILHEVDPAEGGYDIQDFNFKINSDYSIESLDSGTPIYEPLYIYEENNGNKKFIKTEEGILNGSSTINGVTSFEVKLNDSQKPTCFASEGFSIGEPDADGICHGSFNPPIDVSKIEFQHGWVNDGTPQWSIEYVSITTSDGKTYRYDGDSSGNSSGGTGLTNGMNDNNGTVTVSGALLAEAKKDENKLKSFIRLDKTKSGQIHINLEAGDKGPIFDGSIKSEYTLYEIFNMAKSKGQASSIDDIKSVRFIEWTNGEALTGTALLDVAVPEPDPTPAPTPGTSDNSNSLNVRVDGDTIKIPNQKTGDKLNITVKKEWRGDTGFVSLKPESVSVKLKRKTPDGTIDESFTGNDYTQTLNSENGWKYTWTGLDKLVNLSGADDATNYYAYFVTEVTSNANYDVSYGKPSELKGSGGILTVINTLKTTSISGEKKWFESNGTTEATNDIPAITVQLQWKNGNDWENVPSYVDADGNTVTFSKVLNSRTGYMFEFTGLPKNKEYQVIETEVPQGWEKINDGDLNNGYVIKNKRDTNNLKVEKKWNDNNISDRPTEIKVNVYRFSDSSLESGSAGNDTTDASAPAFDPNLTANLYRNYTDKDYTQYEDYARLLQYSLYFYDANMCGDVGNNITRSSGVKSAYDWRQSCHTDDEVVGGFHDAGDYAMFGLPQGYTASTLGWSYYEFKDSYNELGLTNHFKDISKHFADFFYRAVKTDNNGNVTSILYQKGDGYEDHNYKGLPENQPSRSNQMCWTSNETGGSEIAAEYAAALALHYLNFGGDEYLDRAKKIYEYAEKLNKYTTDKGKNVGFYPKELAHDTTYKDDLAWAAAWLAVASKNTTDYDTYKGDVTSYLNDFGNGYLAHQWANVAPAAKVVAASYLDCANYWSDIKTIFDFSNNEAIKNELTKIDNERYYCFNNWGSIRYNLGFQLIALAANKHNSEINLNDWCNEQMQYILGDNKFNKCFVTGFAENSPKYPHYRAIGNFESGEPLYTLVGAVVGGPDKSGNYADTATDYAKNEVALDYNANLVMAVAGLYHLYKTGETYSNVDTAIASYSLTPDRVQSYSNEASVEEDILNGMTFNNDSVAILDGENEYIEFSCTSNKDSEYQYDSLNYQNVTSIDVTISPQNGGGGGFAFHYNNYAGGDNWINFDNGPYTKSYKFNQPTNITEIKLNAIQAWNGGNINVKITFYYGSDTPTPDQPATELELLDTQTIAENISNNQSHSKTFNPAVQNVKRIEIKFNFDNNSQNKVGMGFKYNGTSYTNWTEDAIKSGNTFTWTCDLSEATDISSIELVALQWWNDKIMQSCVVNFYGESAGLKITSDKSIILTENGDSSATITANGEAVWTATFADGSDASAYVNLNASADKKSCDVSFRSYIDQPIKIIATSGSNSDEVSVTLNSADIQIVEGTDIVTDIKLHQNSSKTVTVQPANGIVSVEVADESIVSATPVTAASNPVAVVISLPTESCKITSYDKIGDTEVTFTRNGKTKTLTAYVLEPIDIRGSSEMNKNSTQTLTAVNAVGNVQWEVISGNDLIEIDSSTGEVTSKSEYGRATVKATDSDGTEAEFTIEIKQTAVKPDIPNEKELVKTITLNAGNSWSDTVTNLPKFDANGNKYYYYIEEVTSTLDNSIPGKNNVKYYPVKYEGNGLTLVGGDGTISVTNEKVESETPNYTMPSTGGTGTTWYYITGMALMFIPVVILVRRRKKST